MIETWINIAYVTVPIFAAFWTLRYWKSYCWLKSGALILIALTAGMSYIGTHEAEETMRHLSIIISAISLAWPDSSAMAS